MRIGDDAFGAGLIVRIGAVRVDADDGRRLRPDAAALEAFEQEALHRVLVDRAAAAQPVADPLERLVHQLVERGAGAAVAGELLVGPGGGEALHQLGGRNELDAGVAQQVGGAGVEARHGGDLIQRAVLRGRAAWLPATSDSTALRCSCQVV